LACSIIITVTVYRFMYVKAFDPFWNEEVRKLVVLRIDSLMYGVIGAMLNYYWPSFFRRCSIPGVIVGSVFLILAVVIRFDENLNGSVLLRAIFFPCMSIGFLFLLPFFSSVSIKNDGYLSRAVTTISMWSYSLYLLHVPLMDVFLLFVKKYIGFDFFVDLSIFLLWVVACIFLAAVNYRFFELPCTKLRDHVWRKSLLTYKNVSS